MAVLNRPPSAQPRRGVTSWYRSGGLSSIIFALPLVLTFLYFSWGPIVRGLVLSFQKNNLVTTPEWVGMGNFSYVLTDPQLPQAALNTLYFAFLALLFGFPVPLFLAVFISELRTTGWLYNVFSYLPAVPVSGSGRALYQPIWAEDVADCVVAALRRPVEQAQVRYELAGPETLSHNDIVRTVLRSLSRRRALLHFPTPIVSRGLRLLEAAMGSSAPATWDEAELMEVSMTSPRGAADAESLGVVPQRMAAVLGAG